MRSTKINILPFIFAVFSLFTVQGVVYPFQEFQFKFRQEIVQNGPAVRRRACSFLSAKFKLFHTVECFKLRISFKLASIILQEYVVQVLKYLSRKYENIRFLLTVILSITFNDSYDQEFPGAYSSPCF